MLVPRNILDVPPEELSAWLEARDQPAYRLEQILSWLYREFAQSFQSMTDLPVSLRQELTGDFSFVAHAEGDRRCAKDGGTEKFLFRLADAEEIESVWMRDAGRVTFCISSQAGCSLGCRFCATGAAGFGRNLTVGEILGQVTAMSRARSPARNIVFMGMGEPLLNLNAVLPALEALADPRRFAVSPRRISISTAGVTPGILRLAVHPVHPNLALSLNSPFDAQRTELMPINRRFPLAEVLGACARYGERTGRRLLLEYVLLSEVNTSERHAHAVARIARQLSASVNLIAFNPVDGCGLRTPSAAEVSYFRSFLAAEDIDVSQRFRRGRQIAAGCGQLRGGGGYLPRRGARPPTGD